MNRDGEPLSAVESRMVAEFAERVGVLSIETKTIVQKLNVRQKEILEAGAPGCYNAPETIEKNITESRREKVTTGEAAKYLGISNNSVAGLVIKGKLSKHGHGSVDNESVERYKKEKIDKKTQKPQGGGAIQKSFLADLARKAYTLGYEDGVKSLGSLDIDDVLSLIERR